LNESRLEVLLRLLLLCCGHVGNALRVVQAQRHVHSATGSGLSAGFAGSPQALSGEIDAVGVMDQAVEDGVGVGGIADQRMPLIDRELAGDDGGAAAVAVLKDLQEVVAGRGVERLEAPIVEDEKIDSAERAQDAGVAAVAARQSEIGEQPRNALIEHGTIVAAGLVAERRGEPALADAGGSADQQVGVTNAKQ
jgi:hypothetical protein